MVSDVDCCLPRELHGCSNGQLCSHIYLKGETPKWARSLSSTEIHTRLVRAAGLQYYINGVGGHTSKALLAILGSCPGTRSSPPPKGHLFLSFSLLREKGGKCVPAWGVPVVRGRLVPSAQVTEMNGWPGLSPRPTAGL